MLPLLFDPVVYPGPLNGVVQRIHHVSPGEVDVVDPHGLDASQQTKDLLAVFDALSRVYICHLSALMRIRGEK